MRIENCRHSEKLFSCQCNICRQALVLWIKPSMPGDPPERLLELGDSEHRPAIHFCTRLQARWQQTFVPIFVGEVQHDRGRLRNDGVAVDQHGHLPRWIETKKLRTLVLAGHQIDRDKLKIRVELLKSPECSQ